MIATAAMGSTGGARAAVLGSLLVNLMLALAVAALFSEPLPSQACAAAHTTAHKQPPPRPAPSGRHGYVVEARMGWAVG
jgi:hypothetical protein